MHRTTRELRTTGARGAFTFPALFTATVALAIGGCATPGTPTIDGMPGAPATPATPWTVPAAARSPLPSAEPPTSPTATAALSADSASAGAIQLSMADVVALALQNNPTTRESWALAQSAADQYGSSRGALYPNLNGNVNLVTTSSSASAGGTGGTNSSSTDSLARGTSTGSGGGGGSGTRTQLTPSISLSYLIFDFGGRAGSIEAAKQRAISADLAHNIAVNDVVLQAESGLFSFLATRALRDAQITAVQEATADTAAAEARLRVGVGTLQDVLQTRTALAQARFQLATFQENLLAARGTLAAALGLNANARFEIPNITVSDSVASIQASVDTIVNRALASRPEVTQAHADAAALAAEIRVARSAGYPALTLSSTQSYIRPLQGTSTSGGRNSSLSLGVQIPIFNGFARQYDVRSAKDQYEAGLARVSSAEQRVALQAYTSFAELQASTERVGEAVELLTAAQQSSDVAQGRYREGVGTIVDVLLARAALEQARAEDIQAKWEWHTALAQLAHDVGSLDTAGRPNIPLGGPRPPEP